MYQFSFFSGKALNWIVILFQRLLCPSFEAEVGGESSGVEAEILLRMCRLKYNDGN